MHISITADCVCDNPNKIYAYIDNLARLKLIDIPNNYRINSDDAYRELESCPEVKKMIEQPLL